MDACNAAAVAAIDATGDAQYAAAIGGVAASLAWAAKWMAPKHAEKVEEAIRLLWRARRLMEEVEDASGPRP